MGAGTVVCEAQDYTPEHRDFRVTCRSGIFGGVCQSTPRQKFSFGFSVHTRRVRARPTLGSTELRGAGRLVEAPRAA